MDFAVGADAKVAYRFRFWGAGTQVASSQRDASPTNCCVAGCREMTRPVQLANQQSLRLMQEEWVILRSVPGGHNPSYLSHPSPSHHRLRDVALFRNILQPGPRIEHLPLEQDFGGKRQYTMGREMLRVDLRVEQALVGDSRDQSGRVWTVEATRHCICARC